MTTRGMVGDSFYRLTLDGEYYGVYDTLDAIFVYLKRLPLLEQQGSDIEITYWNSRI